MFEGYAHGPGESSDMAVGTLLPNEKAGALPSAPDESYAPGPAAKRYKNK